MPRKPKIQGDIKAIYVKVPTELYDDLMKIKDRKYSMLGDADIYRMAFDQFRKRELIELENNSPE